MPALGIDNIALAQEHFNGPLILNESYDQAEASQALEDNEGEAVSFGRPFIANPDLVAIRVRVGSPAKGHIARRQHITGLIQAVLNDEIRCVLALAKDLPIQGSQLICIFGCYSSICNLSIFHAQWLLVDC